MRVRAISLLTVAATVSAGLAAGASTPVSPVPATTAAPVSWTVTPGGPYTGAAGRIQLVIARNGVIVTCASSRLTGFFRPGSGDERLAEISTATFSGCTGPSSTMTVRGVGRWSIQGLSYDPVNGVATVVITNIVITLLGSTCGATVSGFLDNVAYVNPSGVLQSVSRYTLTVSNVMGCSGLLANGDLARFVGFYTITPRQIITSP